MKYPTAIVLETSSLCNRYCTTCLRNLMPDRNSVKSWFENNFMSMENIEIFVDQYNQFKGNPNVCLCYYNEPLLDPRIVDISKFLKKEGVPYLYLVTNGDFLTKELAGRLDGVLDRITVSLYENRRARSPEIVSLFKKTKVWIKGNHIVTHYNPDAVPLSESICAAQKAATRIIINHKGQYCLCCDDLTGVFDLGSFPEVNLKDYWFGDKHKKITKDLLIPGGRKKYPYCSICPRVW